MTTTKETEKPFDQRAFTVLGSFLTGLGLPITGVAIHICNHNPLASSGFAWMAAHWILGTLFTFFSVWHIALNGRGLLKHLRNSVKSRMLISREALCAVSIIAVFFLFFFAGHAIHGQP